MNTYIANDLHDRLTQALAAIEPCPFTGKREVYQMVDALMAAGIWPESVKPLPRVNKVEQCVRNRARPKRYRTLLSASTKELQPYEITSR